MKFTVPRYGIVSRAMGLGPRDIGRPARGVGAGKAAQAAYNVADKSSKLAKRAARRPQKNRRAQLAAAREALWFEQHAVRFAFEPADLGKIVTIDGASYRIVGLRPNARKCPVVLQQLGTGKTVAAPRETVHHALKPESPRPPQQQGRFRRNPE